MRSPIAPNAASDGDCSASVPDNEPYFDLWIKPYTTAVLLAKDADPEMAGEALLRISTLYAIEQQIRDQ